MPCLPSGGGGEKEDNGGRRYRGGSLQLTDDLTVQIWLIEPQTKSTTPETQILHHPKDIAHLIDKYIQNESNADINVISYYLSAFWLKLERVAMAKKEQSER